VQLVEVSAIGEIADRTNIPVVGVVEPAPGSGAADPQPDRRHDRHASNGRSGLYDRAMAATDPRVTLHSNACPVFVEYVERGDTTSPSYERPRAGIFLR
jgi:glutamate racemase